MRKGLFIKRLSIPDERKMLKKQQRAYKASLPSVTYLRWTKLKAGAIIVNLFHFAAFYDKGLSSVDPKGFCLTMSQQNNELTLTMPLHSKLG